MLYSTPDLSDPADEKATISRREVIRLLKVNVVAIHDRASGDDDHFAEYHGRPGILVGFCEYASYGPGA